MSTWYEFDYWTQMTIGWYATIFYQMVIFLVGFIVSQLFIAVVCFGFENLDDQLAEIDYSDAVIGLPYVEREVDPDDNLCACLTRPINPLAGARTLELNRGDRSGIRVKVNFLYHYYPPKPLNVHGAYAPGEYSEQLAGEMQEFGVNPLNRKGDHGKSSPYTRRNSQVGSMGLPLPVRSGLQVVGASSVPNMGVGAGGGLPLGTGCIQASTASSIEVAVELSNNPSLLSPKQDALDEEAPNAVWDKRLDEEPCNSPNFYLDSLPGVVVSHAERYAEYRALMQQWKDEAAGEKEAAANAPFTFAEGTETAKEMELRSKQLSTWSNERVFSLHTMLRAQEEIDPNNTVIFYHDNQGLPGKQMENEFLKDLVEAEPDGAIMPQLTVHVRSFIKVVVEPLSIPSCVLPEFSLIGSETIGEVKQMSFEHIRSQAVLPESVELDHCQLYIGGDVFVDDNESLFAVALKANNGDFDQYGDFDPMTMEVFFAITLDSSENLCLSSTFEAAILWIICLNTVTMSMEHYDASDGVLLTLVIFEWMFNIVFTVEMGIKIYCMKSFLNYWRFPSNKFDFVIVVSSWMSVLFESIGLDLAFIKVLRIFRVLRVTRVLRKSSSVREIIDAAFNSIKPIANIM